MQSGYPSIRRCFTLKKNKCNIGREGGVERTAVLAVPHLPEVIMPGGNYGVQCNRLAMAVTEQILFFIFV